MGTLDGVVKRDVSVVRLGACLQLRSSQGSAWGAGWRQQLRVMSSIHGVDAGRHTLMLR